MKRLFLALSAIIHAALLFYPITRKTSTPHTLQTEHKSIRVILIAERLHKNTRIRKTDRTEKRRNISKLKTVPKSKLHRKRIATHLSFSPKKTPNNIPKKRDSSTPIRPARTHNKPVLGIPVNIIPPVLKEKTLPQYPYIARLRRYQGRVLVKALVGKDGRVKKAKVISSSGYRILDKAACEAVKKWKFLPATLGGHPVEWWVEVPIVFRIDYYNNG